MTADTPKARGKLAAALVPVALDLVGRVRQENRDTITDLLDSLTPEQTRALPVVLAAMVDDAHTPGELLAWVTWDEHGRALDPPPPPAPRQLRPCGTHSAFTRHKDRGEDPCQACRDAERTWQMLRARRRSRQRKGAA